MNATTHTTARPKSPDEAKATSVSRTLKIERLAGAHKFTLRAPNGSIEGTFYHADERDAEQRARSAMAQRLNSICGDGKAVWEHPELCASIYGSGEWTLTAERH